MSSLPAVSARRRRTDRIMRGLLGAATVAALIPLVLVIYYVLRKGLGALSWSFFTTDPTGNFLGDPGGIKSAILGTIEIVVLASIIAIPIGIGVALYLVEYGKQGRLAYVIRYFVDVMTGVPSIVFGLFVYVTLVVGTRLRGVEGVGRPRTAHAPHRGALLRGRPAARARFPAGGGPRPRDSALARGPAYRAAHGGKRTGDGRAVVRGSRGRRDRAAPVHREPRQCHQLLPQQAHQLASPADLLRRTASPGPPPGACVGRRADARRPDPPALPLSRVS